MNTVPFAGTQGQGQGQSESSSNRNEAISSLKQQASWPKTTPPRKLSTSRTSSPCRKENHYQKMLSFCPTPLPADHQDQGVNTKTAFLDDGQYATSTWMLHYSGEQSTDNLRAQPLASASETMDRFSRESTVTPFPIQYNGSDDTASDLSRSSASSTSLTASMPDGLLKVASSYQYDNQHSSHAYHIDGRLGTSVGRKKSNTSPLPFPVGCPTFQHPELARNPPAETHRWDKRQHPQQQASSKLGGERTSEHSLQQHQTSFHLLQNRQHDEPMLYGHAPSSTGHSPCGVYDQEPQQGYHECQQYQVLQQYQHHQVKPLYHYPLNQHSYYVGGFKGNNRSFNHLSGTPTSQPFQFEQRYFNFQTQELTTVKPRPFQLSDFTVNRTIGTGSCGRVLLVQSVFNFRFYALKVLKKRQVVQSNQIEHVNEEKRILEKIRHPFLVKTWGTFQDTTNLYIVMDYVVGGELFSVLRRIQVIHRDGGRPVLRNKRWTLTCGDHVS
jgi:hypothetical protein